MVNAFQSVDTHSWWVTLLQGLLSIVIGLLIIVWPQESLTILVGLTGRFLSGRRVGTHHRL
jgi:uncharacterized membrane protein HdeD (DUF308 family)